MVWHIFKKDWKLLWKFFLAVAAIQFLPAAIRLKQGFFGEDPTLDYLIFPAIIIAMLGSAFLSMAIVQQDSIPSVCEDWLTRPIPHRDLLLAKLLFVLVLVQGSVFLTDTSESLAMGFPVGSSLSGALAHNIYWIAAVTLPALVLASITRNMTEAIVAGTAAFCGGSAIEILAISLNGGQTYLHDGSGIGEAWVTRYSAHLLILLGACVVLGIQYFRRKTTMARWMAASVLLLFVVVQFLPWKAVFAIQRQMSQNPGAGDTLSPTFDPSLGRFQNPSGIKMSDDTKPEAYLPLQVEGLPKDTVLHVDKSEVRVIDSNGHVVYRGEGDGWELRRTEEAKPSVYQRLVLPGSLYARLKDKPLRLEFDYSLTSMRASSIYAVPAFDGILRTPGLGICETEMDETRTAVELRCRQIGNGSTCRSAFLENAATGQRNPEIYACVPDYSPSLERANKTPLSSYGLNIPFRDPAGLIHYSVDGPQLSKSNVMMTLYEPEDHFTRQLIIPSVRLTEWRIQ